MADEQNQRNIDNNANNINNAADVAIASKNPYGVAIGGAVKAADKITGGKSTQALGKVMNTANKIAPGGRKIQKASNKMSESGASDKIGTAARYKNSMSSGGKKEDIPNALKNPNPNNDNLGKNNADKNKKTNSSNEGLPEKEGLKNDNDGLDSKKKKKDAKKEQKEKNKNSNDSDSEEKKSKENLITKAIKRKLLILKIKLIAIFAGFLLFILVLGSLFIIYDQIMTPFVSLFGIREAGDDENGGLWTDEKYMTNSDGTDVGLTDYVHPDGTVEKGLYSVLEDERGKCNTDSLIYFWFNNIWTDITGEFGGDACRLLNYIWGTAAGYEERYSDYGLNVDENLIISTLFFGFDEQLNQLENKEENDSTVSASYHYESLESILEGGTEAILLPEDIDKIIKNTIYEEIWPYFRWNVKPLMTSSVYQNYTLQTTLSKLNLKGGETAEEKADKAKFKLNIELNQISSSTKYTIDQILSTNNTSIEELVQRILSGETNIVIKIPALTGKCEMYTHKFLYGSSHKWEVFMRFNDKASGFVGDHKILSSKPALDRSIIATDYNYDSLYGEGWVYETNMNNSWLNSSPECNGSMSLSEIKSKYRSVDVYSIQSASSFYNDRGYTSPKNLTAYSQRVTYDNLYTVKKDSFNSSTRSFADTKGKEKNELISFKYKDGYAYETFPTFKTAIDSENKNYVYDDITTPKKIEVVLKDIFEREDEFDDILYGEDREKENTPSYNEGSSLTVTDYCKKTQKEGFGSFEVVISNCAGDYLETRSFKEYVLGTTLAEIGYHGDDLPEYVKTQMVAVISYVLTRNSNYKHDKVFYIRSGSCDQNWCDIYQGCSRSYTGGYVQDDGTILMSTYPGVVEDSETKASCNLNGVSYTGYYTCALTQSQLKKYSELFDEAARYVLAQESNEFVGSGGSNGAYVSTVQIGWSNKAKAGMDFINILKETYEDQGQEVIDCLEYANTYLNCGELSPDNVDIYENYDMPYYYQYDPRWGNKSYNGTTLAKSGCGYISLSMIVSSFNDVDLCINPDSVHEYIYGTLGLAHLGWGSGAITNTALYDQRVLDYYNVDAEVIFHGESVEQEKVILRNALSAGKKVVILVPGHFVAVAGNESEVFVFDPANKGNVHSFTYDQFFSSSGLLCWGGNGCTGTFGFGVAYSPRGER